jgi:hypothetical protein
MEKVIETSREALRALANISAKVATDVRPVSNVLLLDVHRLADRIVMELDQGHTIRIQLTS